MKYKQFRNLVAVVVFFGVGGSCYACYGCWQSNLAQEAAAEKQRRLERESEEKAREARRLAELEHARHLQAARDAQLAEAAKQAAASPGGYWSKASGLRPVDVDVLAALQRPVVDKLKDAARGKPYKVNVYADDGKRFNRVKVDLDRDEKDDESWTIFADGRVERKVSTKDDGTMDGHFVLEMSGWVDTQTKPAAGASPAIATATTTTAADAGPNARPVDQDMTRLRQSLSVADKVKDATEGKPYKINLYSDDLKAFNRAKVDLDRDDKWDESWTWKDGGVERQVAPADDETYSEVYVWQGGAWKKKP